MNDLQAKTYELILKKEELKSQMKEVNAALESLLLELGEGNAFQAYDGTVVKVVSPNGKFISFDRIDFVRTKREGEVKGSLSKKEAEEMGFVLTK
jgi:hypothetical protein